MKRDVAARARRLAKSLALNADRERLERHADELDKEAAELERHARAAAVVPVAPSPTVIQMQQQQQHDVTPPAAGSTDEKSKP